MLPLRVCSCDVYVLCLLTHFFLFAPSLNALSRRIQFVLGSLDAGDSKKVDSLEELKTDDVPFMQAKIAFYESVANTYPKLKFEVTGIARVKPSVSAAALANYEAVKKSVASA